MIPASRCALLVVIWVASGLSHVMAEGSAGSETDVWWAYKPPTRPALPDVENKEWVRNPIDAFVLSRLEAAGLAAAAPCDDPQLVRRVYYDLTGLPPSPMEVDAYLADRAPDAYERLIERLLATPQYGEKWGRLWLDVVRYAETNGYERDGLKPNAWRYRDYVIRAFNEDKPYDRFVKEQLAGDELYPASDDALIATGFQRLGLWDDEPVDADAAFFDTLDDVVSTTAQAFLGMTIGCARCHDHKIDPLPQTDYYRLLAFFRNTLCDIQRGEFEDQPFQLNTQCPLPEGSESDRAEFQRQVAGVEAELAALRAEIDRFEQKILDALTPSQREEARIDQTRAALLERHAAEVLSSDKLAAYQALRQRLEHTAPPPPPSALSIQENQGPPPPTYVLVRGNVHAPGEKVTPGYPRVLGFDDPVIIPPRKGDTTCGRRKVLANWIADGNHPLTARVMVNRIWQVHFGRGIVRSANDFGRAGDAPTHPELLDWLAREFVEQGWSIKQMHRLVMTSNTYRMSSQPRTTALEVDPENDLFSRFDMRRLTAEEIRDSMLLVAGILNLTAGGPSVYPPLPPDVLATASRPEAAWGNSPPEDAARRSVYVHAKRSLRHPLLAGFDAADTDTSCPARFATTVPTQALSLLNSQFAQDIALQFARRIKHDMPGRLERQVEWAIRWTTARQPSADEVAQDVRFIENLIRHDGLTADEALSRYCLMMVNSNEFLYLD